MANGRNEVWQGLRKLIALQRGYRCVYCSVPTAATIEHLTARTKGGEHTLENLALACPYCNTRKGNRMDAAAFAASGEWRLETPTELGDLRAMLAREFGWKHPHGFVRSGTPNARLELSEDGKVSLLVRAGADDPWVRFRLGPADHPVVAARAYDFLVRHQTPARPKPLPGRLFVSGGGKRKRRA